MTATVSTAPLRLPALDRRIPDWSLERLSWRPCPLCDCEHDTVLIRPDGLPVAYCPGCSLWYVARVPDAAAMDDFYSRYWRAHRRTSLSAETAREIRRGLREDSPAEIALLQLEAALGSLRGRRILEVGCGAGAFLVAARERGAIVAGSELSEEAASFARSFFDLPVYTDGLEGCRTAAGPFDAIVMLDVIEHIAQPAGFLEALVSALKPGGVLLLWTPNGGAAGEGREDMAAGWVGFRVDLEHLQYLSAAAIGVLARRHGLDIEHLETLGVPDLAGACGARPGLLRRLRGRVSTALSSTAPGRRLVAYIRSVLTRDGGHQGTYHLLTVLRRPLAHG
jgi:2-polyprenyl-3-methyl-5-hydroxy-6-metoxy-1,4-benzoquinol methylase